MKIRLTMYVYVDVPDNINIGSIYTDIKGLKLYSIGEDKSSRIDSKYLAHETMAITVLPPDVK